MGRHITGDINTKLWFAVQPSDAPSRFGGSEYEPQYIEYAFEEDDLDDVVKELKTIEDTIGKETINKFNKFFDKNGSYNEEILEKAGLDPKYLSDYADYLLGIKIRNKILETGQCYFEAEL